MGCKLHLARVYIYRCIPLKLCSGEMNMIPMWLKRSAGPSLLVVNEGPAVEVGVGITC